MQKYRIVSPYRDFVPDNDLHRKLEDFDWRAALAMLCASARYCADAEVVALTDTQTEVPIPAFRYAPRAERLMLWILDVSLAYLESSDFDRDTWMISPDMLVLRDPSRALNKKADLAVLARPEHFPDAIINHTQFWSYKAKDRLIAFYRLCYRRAQGLPEKLLEWGADTEPLIHFLSPVVRKGARKPRHGLKVLFIPQQRMTRRVSEADLTRADWRRTRVPLAEFTNMRKAYMAAYFEKAFAHEIRFGMVAAGLRPVHAAAPVSGASLPAGAS